MNIVIRIVSVIALGMALLSAFAIVMISFGELITKCIVWGSGIMLLIMLLVGATLAVINMVKTIMEIVSMLRSKE